MKLAHVFFGCDLRCGHLGLFLLLDEEEIELKENDFAVFFNTKRTMMKFLSGHRKLLLHYNNNGKPIDPRIIPEIPNFFDGENFSYTKTLEKTIKRVLERKGYKV